MAAAAAQRNAQQRTIDGKASQTYPLSSLRRDRTTSKLVSELFRLERLLVEFVLHREFESDR
jgi:hypothetical protein